jgi:hypothetical protein
MSVTGHFPEIPHDYVQRLTTTFYEADDNKEPRMSMNIDKQMSDTIQWFPSLVELYTTVFNTVEVDVIDARDGTYHIAREINRIGKNSKRGVGNVIIHSDNSSWNDVIELLKWAHPCKAVVNNDLPDTDIVVMYQNSRAGLLDGPFITADKGDGVEAYVSEIASDFGGILRRK